VGSHPNVWLFIQSLIGQEPDFRRMLMHNAMGMDTPQPGWGAFQGQQCKDHGCGEEISNDLSPYLYMQILAKLVIAK
jgi:hypothetical protein